MVYLGFTRNQDSMANRTDYVELGLACAEVCKALDRGMNGRQMNDLSQSVFEAIEQLTTWVQPAMHILGYSFTEFAITGLWPRSRGASSRGVNEMRYLELSTRRTIKGRSRPGGWTSIGSSISSTCVPPPLRNHG